MTKRGKVLRDTTLGQGLLIVEGQQCPFSREGEWKSESAPKPGQVVDVELDSRGKVRAITVVPDAQLAREQAATAVSSRTKHHDLAFSLVERIGLPSLAAAGLLAAAWFFLTAASVEIPFPGKLDFTFWQILGCLNAGRIPEFLDGSYSPSSGFYGVAAVLAIAGPFIHFFWRDRIALLGGLMPLMFMVVIGIVAYVSIRGKEGWNSPAHTNLTIAFSLGLGAYLALLACLYFAFVSAKGLVARPRETRTHEATPRKAA